MEVCTRTGEMSHPLGVVCIGQDSSATDRLPSTGEKAGTLRGVEASDGVASYLRQRSAWWLRVTVHLRRFEIATVSRRRDCCVNTRQMSQACFALSRFCNGVAWLGPADGALSFGCNPPVAWNAGSNQSFACAPPLLPPYQLNSANSELGLTAAPVKRPVVGHHHGARHDTALRAIAGRHGNGY